MPGKSVSILDGGNQMASGDLLGGMKAVVPVAFKSPTEAYRMTTEGYVDSQGRRLPISPGAADIMWQLMGFTPSEKAEYSEARSDQAARRGLIARRAGQLRQNIVKALQDGDRQQARELITEAIKFDQDNPAFAVIPSLGGTLQRQQQARMQSAALRAPIGVSMQDIAGQQLTRYADVNYRQ